MAKRIDLGIRPLEVDGVKYRLGVLSAMDVFRGTAWAMRCFGAPMAEALAVSDGLGNFIAKLSDESTMETLLDLDSEKPAELFGRLARVVDLGSLLSVLGDAARITGERLRDHEIRDLMEWAVNGKLHVPSSTMGERLVEDEGTFDLCLAEHIKAHGPLHVLRLLWAVLRSHTGPTSAGGTGETPARQREG